MIIKVTVVGGGVGWNASASTSSRLFEVMEVDALTMISGVDDDPDISHSGAAIETCP